ncbi:MAG: hypothetical protein J6O04_09760 [Selenomonadaceae bacterium]|nr:hypothetical protein [Selenomonadaceae bacterium]
MNDFRVVLESKALDSIKNNLDKLDKTDYDISISKIFREKYKDLLKNRLVDFDLNITLPDLIASSDWDTFLNSISNE